jgi:hypothetical protein
VHGGGFTDRRVERGIHKTCGSSQRRYKRADGNRSKEKQRDKEGRRVSNPKPNPKPRLLSHAIPLWRIDYGLRSSTNRNVLLCLIALQPSSTRTATRILHSKAAAVPLGCCLVRPLHLQSLGHSRNRCCFIFYFVSLPPSHHSCVCMCSFHTFVLLLFCSCLMIACSAP